ncbi:kelch-like protein 38 isoform X4 [Paramacrobiotus metropolitanus]|uniref:kelch-like protein 38 isoform X4 n=1 Tax=Paramacrobiotus metropolitanus TaxID=2943436 RepID=UPI00244567C6|nr:kelch-like protein 38 isoform X4 [Paramacrobiotus metropolitanus]
MSTTNLPDPDVCLKGTETDSEWIPCQRSVLSQHSPFFAAMFASEMKESREEFFQLHDIPHNVLMQLISYMYLREISVDKDNALPLLQASHMLDMPRIVRKCTECLEWSVDLTNCWSIAQWAEMLSCHELAKKVRNILCGNFLAMFRCEAFLELDKNMVKELLGSDDLDVDSEDRVGEALYDWLDGSVKERMSAALDMLGLLRVAHLSTAFLRFLQKSPTARPLYLAMRTGSGLHYRS